MIDHIDIVTTNLRRACDFYAAILPNLGYSLSNPGSPNAGFNGSHGKDFWLTEKPELERVHFAFRADSKSVVEIAYRAAIEAGARSYRAPCLMPQVHPHYFAAQVYDPDGYLVEFACHNAG